jgi:predicted RNase H-like HicB family nuclease
MLYLCKLKKIEMEYTVILEKMDNGWWFCQCEQIPEAVTQGETIEEAKENIKEAIELVLAAKKELTRKQFTGRRILRRKIAVL